VATAARPEAVAAESGAEAREAARAGAARREVPGAARAEPARTESPARPARAVVVVQRFVVVWVGMHGGSPFRIDT
jgi:hypothetical protein